MKLFETCCADIQSVIAANQGGADRIELCTALEVDGLTPSCGLIEEALNVSRIPVRVLIRPRPGNFVYTAAEISVMKRDIEQCRCAGVDGVVIGALTPAGDIDIDACRAMMDSAAGLHVTFHRAFDVCTHPKLALKQIISLGADTLLTSGQQPKAIDGIDLISQLVDQSAGRIDIMAGSGVNPSNAARILQITGCNCLHGSARANGITDAAIVNQLRTIAHDY